MEITSDEAEGGAAGGKKEEEPEVPQETEEAQQVQPGEKKEEEPEVPQEQQVQPEVPQEQQVPLAHLAEKLGLVVAWRKQEKAQEQQEEAQAAKQEQQAEAQEAPPGPLRRAAGQALADLQPGGGRADSSADARQPGLKGEGGGGGRGGHALPGAGVGAPCGDCAAGCEDRDAVRDLGCPCVCKRV